MAEDLYVVASSFSLSGGTLGGDIAVKSFSGLEWMLKYLLTVLVIRWEERRS